MLSEFEQKQNFIISGPGLNPKAVLMLTILRRYFCYRSFSFFCSIFIIFVLCLMDCYFV